MRKFTEDMKYELIENNGYYISQENIHNGTVRVIDGDLYYSEEDIIYSDTEIYDPITCKMSKSRKVIVWKPVP